MARRRNAIFHRLSRMRGLPPDEKMLMQRIGHMMDAALNNRQASNPYEPSKNNPHRVLYPPTGLVAYTGYRTLKLVWKAADSDQHLRYDVRITNTETGASETKTTYTNELRYKNINGSYKAVVKSVGRDGSSSSSQTIEFTMGASVMQIEGSKNGPTELGTIVQDHITLYDGYSIYAWGSLVLDKFIAGASNKEAVFRLWSMEGANQTFNASRATLEQTITLYAATESFANLDSNAHAASIIRPTTTRPGTFETSQSVMFSPISIDTSEEEVTYTFFLQALGRETEADEVNLSLVLWGGFDGLGDNIPQDPWEGGASAYVFPHLNSLRVSRKEMTGTPPATVAKGSWYMASQRKEYNIIDNAWTLAIWFRLESEHTEVMYDNSNEANAKLAAQNVIFRRSSYNADGEWDHNSIEVVLDAGKIGSDYYQYVTCTVGDEDGTTSVQAKFYDPVWGSHSGSDLDDDSYIWGDIIDLYEWQFMVICFEGGAQGAGTDTPKIRIYCNNRHIDNDNPSDRHYPANKMESLNQRIADGALTTLQTDPPGLLGELNQDLTDDYLYTIGLTAPSSFFTAGEYQGSQKKDNDGTFTIHQAGMWNVAIDNWDGMGFNPGSAEQRDSSPWYAVPYTGATNPHHESGRESTHSGSSLTALHYLYNQGYGTDIDWKKNSNTRPDGAKEYIFAENLIHLWQFGAIADEYSATAETLRDTGNYLYRGDVNFLRQWDGLIADGVSSNLWSDDTSLADIYSPVRSSELDPWTNYDTTKFPPIEWADPDLPNWTDQLETVQPVGHINGAGYPDAGTRAHYWSYPGQFPVIWEAWEPGLSTYLNAGWRRPNTTNGVLDEPKTWGPIWYSDSLAQAELDTGIGPL